VTALNNLKPDGSRAAVRAEFTGRHAVYTCQQLSSTTGAFEGWCAAARISTGVAVPASMVYVWTGLTDAAGVRYYGVPGVDVPTDCGFQYRSRRRGGVHARGR
jgi:hypothetical protein